MKTRDIIKYLENKNWILHEYDNTATSAFSSDEETVFHRFQMTDKQGNLYNFEIYETNEILNIFVSLGAIFKGCPQWSTLCDKIDSTEKLFKILNV